MTTNGGIPRQRSYRRRSVTLEWSVDDFAISRSGHLLGDTATAAVFQNRSRYCRTSCSNSPSPAISRPGARAGFFPTVLARGIPSGWGAGRYDEGNAEQYLWWCRITWAGFRLRFAAARLSSSGSTALPKLNVGPNPLSCGPVTSPLQSLGGCG